MTEAAQDFAIKEFLDLYGSSPPPLNDLIELLYGYSTSSDYLNAFYDVSNPAFQLLQIIQNKVSDPGFNMSTLRSFGFTYDEFFSYDSINSQFSSNYFNWFYDLFYENCFRFNSGQMEDGSQIGILEQNFGGYRNGLLTINFIGVFAKQAYSFMSLNLITNLRLRVSIDDQNDFPLTYNKMLLFNTGTSTYVS
jgi:hypothetical protein